MTDGYGYDMPPRSAGADGKSDHGRVVTSGAWLASMAAALLLTWADGRMPYICAWLLNTAAVLGAAYGMARWKRAWYAWLCFWALAAVCALNGLLKAFTPLLDSQWSSATWILAWLIAGCWYWLIRAPRRRRPAVPQEIHVIHHHVLHDGRGAGAAWSMTAEVPQREVTASAPKALEPPRLSPEDNLGARVGRIRRQVAAHLRGPR
jgi:hypothetical protein